MFQLRDYQTETINNIYQSMAKGNKAIVVQQPPRTGKTVIMSEIARRTTKKGNHLLFIVHRKELIDQAKSTFIKNDVDMSLCQIGMVQTLTRHLERLIEPQVILVDEAHHALAKTYRNIIERFPNAIKLYFTATPVRANGKGMADIATDLIQGKQIPWLIKNDFMAPVDYYAPIAIQENALKKASTGDYTKSSIDNALKNTIYGDAVHYYQKLADGKQAIVYTHSVKSAYQTAEKFCDAGYTCYAVDGGMKKDQRDTLIKAFKNGQVQILVNDELFTEGLDLPNVDCVIMLRPTASLPLYLQFAMRCMNPRPGKRAVIIDHVGNVDRFGLPTIERWWNLKGVVKKQKDSKLPALHTCQECFGTFFIKDAKNGCCPLCGAPLPVQKQKSKEIIVDKKAKLAKVKADDKKAYESAIWQSIKNKDWHELKSYKQLIVYAKKHGFKPGWAWYKAKELGMIH